jgi:prevent-host-death family protein
MSMRAGIRELRQNLSQYVERVKAGETVEVTEYGRLVAVLVPRADRESELAGDRRGTAHRGGSDLARQRRAGPAAPDERWRNRGGDATSVFYVDTSRRRSRS